MQRIILDLPDGLRDTLCDYVEQLNESMPFAQLGIGDIVRETLDREYASIMERPTPTYRIMDDLWARENHLGHINNTEFGWCYDTVLSIIDEMISMIKPHITVVLSILLHGSKNQHTFSIDKVTTLESGKLLLELSS